MKLENKVAIVTGGAMGNGLGIVKVFLKYGAKVAIFDYSEKVTEVAESFKAEGFDVLGYLCDVRDNEAIKANVADVLEKFGTIDILVNNAGIAWLDTFMNTDDKLRDAHFDINIIGSWNMAIAVVPTLID